MQCWRTLPPPVIPASDSAVAELLKFVELDSICGLLQPGKEYLIRSQKGCILEPQFGYLITQPFKLIEEALPGCDAGRSRKSLESFSGALSISKLLFSKSHTIPTQKIPAVVLMRHVYDHNYYHFFVDVMSRLALLDEYKVDPRVPLVVGPRLANQAFFKEAIRRGRLAERTWIVQDGFYITVSTLRRTR